MKKKYFILCKKYFDTYFEYFVSIPICQTSVNDLKYYIDYVTPMKPVIVIMIVLTFHWFFDKQNSAVQNLPLQNILMFVHNCLVFNFYKLQQCNALISAAMTSNPFLFHSKIVEHKSVVCVNYLLIVNNRVAIFQHEFCIGFKVMNIIMYGLLGCWVVYNFARNIYSICVCMHFG